MLSSRSRIPPWLPNSKEKSLIFKYLLICEKKISPINRNKEIIIEIKILKLNNIKRTVVAIKDIDVPDHVFFGLIFGNMSGPFINLPAIYAIVSLKNEVKIIR